MIMMKRQLKNDDFLLATARPPHLQMVNCFLICKVTLGQAGRQRLRNH